MNRLISSKYGWIILLVILVLFNAVAASLHFRFDLTAEKRYTLSPPTKKLLRNLNETVKIQVLLDGDLPAGFKKLRNSTQEMLSEFKENGKQNLQIVFSKPGDGLSDSLRSQLQDSLTRLGIQPMNIKAQAKEGEGEDQRLLYPAALVTYKDRTLPVDLLAGQSSILDEASINRAEATLEYKLASTIRKITQDSIPLIGYLIGNGEPLSYNVFDLLENTLRKNYAFRILNIDSVAAVPPLFGAIIITKPSISFKDEQKLKIDQYIMHGGKVIWMIDNLYAEMDSLQRSQNEFIAFDRGLNIEDQLFKYGVRINLDLLQDLNCDGIPSVIGTVAGKPQMGIVPWPYFPLLGASSNHPVVKNLDYVVSQFPNTIDTVKANGINKTILLSSSGDARILTTPVKVSWNSVQNEEDKKTFTKHQVPVAVLLEGKFSSLFANRVSQVQKDSFAAYHLPFLPANEGDNKMIVIADGDIALNAVTQKDGPLPMGMNMYTRYQYANKEFIMNCIEYMTDNSGILETRGKDFTLRLLDKKKVEEEKAKWQFINMAVPVLLVLLFGLLYQYLRKRKYQGS